MGAWRQTVNVTEETGGTYTVEHIRKQHGAPVVQKGLTADQVVEFALAPPEIKDFRWYNIGGRYETQPPEPIRERMEAKGLRFFGRRTCDACGDTGTVAGVPCRKCQAV